MENTKYFSINNLQEVATDASKDLAIARVAVLSTAPNTHKVNITEEILRRDVPSILGKFVVAEYSKLRKDVTTHSDGEVIVGYIPTNQEVEFIEEDGYIVAYVNAVISKVYATDVYKLFIDNNFRSASVEMATSNDVELPDGSIDIDGIEIYGITILGKTVNGSCPQANIKMVRFSAEEAKDYYTKETAIKLSNELRKFAESLDSKDNTKTKEIEMADNKNLSEEEDKDVVMSEADDKTQDAEPKSEEKSEDGVEEMAEDTTAEFADEDENKEMSEVDKTDESDDDKTDEDETDKQVVDKEETEDDEQADEIDMACEDKEFSLTNFASKELVESIKDEKVGEFIKMSADEMIKAFAEIVEENKTLVNYKTNVEMAERDEKVNSILANVKLDLSEEQYRLFSEEAKEVTLDGVDAFANKVKAFAYENAKKNSRTDSNKEIFVFGGDDKNTKTIEDDDVFNRLAKM